MFFDIPVGYLLRAERTEDKIYSYVEIFIKYGVSVKVKYADPKSDNSTKTQQLLTHLIDTASQIPFEYGSKSHPHLRC